MSVVQIVTHGVRSNVYAMPIKVVTKKKKMSRPPSALDEALMESNIIYVKGGLPHMFHEDKSRGGMKIVIGEEVSIREDLTIHMNGVGTSLLEMLKNSNFRVIPDRFMQKGFSIEGSMRTMNYSWITPSMKGRGLTFKNK